jgi:drug/metabolite transporter (DMT)-like permease
MGIGEWAALGAALLWTLSSMLWGRIDLSALSINLCKNIIGTILIAINMFVLASFSQLEPFSADTESWMWLGLSGIVGIVIGDTFYFRSLQILGPRRALMMATTGPIFSAILGWMFLREDLMYWAIVGIVMTISGVIVVVADRKAAKEAPGLMPGRIRLGVMAGVMGAVCQAVGGVLSKKGMRDEAGVEICNALEATFIRIMIAGIATVIIVLLRKELVAITKKAIQWNTLRLLVPATALGTWLGIYLSQIAISNTDVAIAQTLLSTCPLFAIPIVWIVSKHRVTALSIIGTIIALVGIGLVVRFS